MGGKRHLVLAQHVDGERSARDQEGIRCVPRVYTEREQERIKGRLHHPGGGEGIALAAVGDAHDIDAVGKLAEKVCDRGHVSAYSQLV